MKLSIIVRCKNEYPIILGTINSLVEDCEATGINYEIIIVDNASTDDLADVLEDRYRRWIRTKLLKVVRYTEKASTWCAINAGYKVADGDILAFADAHISVKINSIRSLIDGVISHGGINHVPSQVWGDVEEIKLYGHDLTLDQNFWSGACLRRPKMDQDPDAPWKIALAGACLLAISREEIQNFSYAGVPYNPFFRSYGGGEPYLAFKWWMLGSAVWMNPTGLVRHAFGTKAVWKTAKHDIVPRNSVYRKDGQIVKELKAGDIYLSYEPGYTVANEDRDYNFMLASFVLGGDKWLDHMTKQFASKFRDPETTKKLAAQIRIDGKEDRKFILKHQVRDFDEMLRNPLWELCGGHEYKIPEPSRI
jgi:glycosyltransferase involved in cell wall biosynthesis